ncbi:transcriptional regulator, TetR family [Kaistia soli DSM 19436]|uniref:Transcriptional regulator, TetR family n=1 Tax=Kaistia soli DSM 19436 TaxID=1122133 RepID=A0A1M5IBV1_9HYPH|nr:TetR family transcriptional regulator [Kaistia soli]SHG25786.1 transcriptional regulator, TetR family [Kaistia soli DSM 19436]
MVKQVARRLGAPSGPRAANVAETRERILQAAIRQFARHGFAGARIDVICAEAGVNARMIYHYYSDKAGLYVAVLERVLGDLRIEELKLEIDESRPLDGLLTMFEFTFRHFARHPELVRLLSAENLLEGQYLKGSESTPMVASPVIGHIGTLLARGEATGALRPGLDPVHLYVTMVALCYFHKSNAYTLSAIFRTDIGAEDWQQQHFAMARAVLAAYLAPPAQH